MAPRPPGRGLTDGIRLFPYVGPPTLAEAARTQPPGTPARTRADLSAWLGARPPAEHDEPFTYTVGADGVLRLAPRRSEHVACAGGEPVGAAGEIAFVRAADGWMVDEADNLSTGYCPDPDCWTVLAAALDTIGVGRPDAFTRSVVFRRCPRCGERNVVRDGYFTCALCDADLPSEWNFA
ncbi:hypothetical protein [Streptodolium elevatio]|uniref:Zinc ribbon domain-containing protein n=1 Tax=Streptodolium elevatio TaxID=3157996 RepID=A0ABV3DJT4_9ACTN